MSFEREKTDENIDRKYEDSHNIDFMMMRKQYTTLSKTPGKFGENPKKLVWLEPRVSWLRTGYCFTDSVEIIVQRREIIYNH